MYYVYALRSLKDGEFYIGFTKDIDKRLAAHNNRQVQATRNRIPFEIVYYEASRNINDAINREKYLKTTYGKRYLTNRLKELSSRVNISRGKRDFGRYHFQENIQFCRQSRGSICELIDDFNECYANGYIDRHIKIG